MSRSRASASTTKAPATSPASDARVVKKYPNRRMYDTSSSSYITLAQVRELVMAHEAFVVRDAKSGEDLTRSILLQIILEEEAGGAPMFTEAVLAHIIRFYGHALQGFMGNYLERSMQLFLDQQSQFRSQLTDLIVLSPTGKLTDPDAAPPDPPDRRPDAEPDRASRTRTPGR